MKCFAFLKKMKRFIGKILRAAVAFLFLPAFRKPLCITFALFIGLFLSASALSQYEGTIKCNSGSTTSVPAWTAPGRPHVVEQLSCGQIIEIVDMERGYVKIKIADKSAYVDPKYVRLSQSQERLRASKGKNGDVKGQHAAPIEEQRKWDVVAGDRVKLRDETLIVSENKHRPSTFMATLRNNSEFPISHLHLLVRLYDCPVGFKGNSSDCDIIGEVNTVISALIPSGQTRGVEASLMFEATPPMKGVFAWDYRILRVRAE